MKKITILAVAALAISFASCKKERVCECVSSSDAPGSTSSTTKITYTKAKKSVCKDNSQSQIAVAPVAGTYTTKWECTLK
jgi:hypothetical protein